MKTFTYLFGSMLGKLVLKRTDNLSRTLQHVSMSAAEGQEVTSTTVATLNSMRSDDHFDLYGDVVILKAEELSVSEPQLPRQRKLPRRYDDGTFLFIILIFTASISPHYNNNLCMYLCLIIDLNGNENYFHAKKIYIIIIIHNYIYKYYG